MSDLMQTDFVRKTERERSHDISDNWRRPYRTMDAHGAPDTAGAVGWEWIQSEGRRLMQCYGSAISVESIGNSDGTSVFALYHGTALKACATIFRDQMNFAVLIRWKAEI